MSSDRIRVVLDNSVEEGELTPLAGRHHWIMLRSIAQSGDQPEEYIYSTRTKDTLIHWIQDHKIGVRYILVSGPDASNVSALVRKKLLHFHPDYILEQARDAALEPVERRVALYHLALDKMEHGFDRETFEIYERAMRDSSPIVRGAAVLGSAYLGWPQLAEPMRALAGPGETDESVRADAATLSSRLDQLAASP